MYARVRFFTMSALAFTAINVLKRLPTFDVDEEITLHLKRIVDNLKYFFIGTLEVF